LSRLHWIEARTSGRLAIAARPRADDWLEAEIAEWKCEGIDAVLSLLEREEILELKLQREAELCQSSGLEFISFPIPDRGVPAIMGDAIQLARSIADSVAHGHSVAVHCRAGIGRSSIIAATVLICSGVGAAQALASIGGARGLTVPDTEEQRNWVMVFERAYALSRRA
jgi:protein-tyrosine phosphatase